MKRWGTWIREQDEDDLSSPRRLAVSKDGRLLCVATRDNCVRVWNTDTGKMLHTLPLDLPGSAVAVSQNGDTIVGGTIGSRPDASQPVKSNVFAWSLSGGNPRLLWKSPQLGASEGLALHPRGVWCASLSVYGRLHLFDLQTGGFRRVCIEHGNGFRDLALSSDGRIVVTAGQHLKFWEPQRLPFPNQSLPIETTATEEESQRFIHAVNGSGALAVAFASRQTWAMVLGTYADMGGRTETLARFDASTGKPLAVLARGVKEATCITLSPDDRFMAVGFRSPNIEIRATDSGAVVRTLDLGDFGPIRSLSYLHKGESLAIASRHGTHVAIYNVANGKRVREFLPDR